MAEATGQVDAPEVVDGAKCPFARVNNLEDVSRLLWSKTDNPPVGLEKDMDKFDVDDIPRYIKYPAIFDGGSR